MTRSRPTHPRRWMLVLGMLAVLFVSGCAARQPAADPGVILTGGALSSPVLLAGKESVVYARVRIDTRALPPRERGALNLAIALDTSGSMQGDAIEAAKHATLEMVDALVDGDRLAIVVFHTKAEVLVPSSKVTPRLRARVHELVGELQALGTTEMQDGLVAAISEVRTNASPDSINRVVLLGDGVPNHGESLEAYAVNAGEAGIPITTLGLGLDYDEILMGRIAQVSGGRYRYIEDPGKVAAFFEEEVNRIDNVYARRMRLTMTPGPGVVIDAVLNDTTSDRSARVVPLGDVVRGERREVVVALRVTPRKADAALELLDVNIEFEDAVANAGALQRRVYFGGRASASEEDVARAHDKDVELSAALARASSTTVRALEFARVGQNILARDMLQAGAAEAENSDKSTPSEDLKKRADEMRAVANSLPADDRVAPQPNPSSSGYQFEDEVQAIPEQSNRDRKALHESSLDRLR
ncbi:MAG: VWA domain-containing protein [Polyangiaceae bacterium]